MKQTGGEGQAFGVRILAWIRGRGCQKWGYLGLIVASWMTASWWQHQGVSARSSDWLSSLPPADRGQVHGLLAWLGDCPGPGPNRWTQSASPPSKRSWDRPSSNSAWDGVKLEVNDADSAAWEGLPWVGPGLAGRICSYRKRLGGFWNMEQLGEVWGIPPEALDVIAQRCTLDASLVVPLCADTASWNSMRKHPYIGTSGARLIERYRTHHPLRSPEDLRSSPVVSDSLWRLWKPYLRVCLTEE
jgi:DNA uptake protein ComE-like DNA-binding protein